MLALVKKPRIEISLQGEKVDELIDWISKKFEVSILSSDDTESIAVEDTDFWKEMQSNRIGNLLAGARLKANLSQAQLAEKLGIRQNMISDYERGKRRM
jgi:ribosome-binding protein aMBF1 (putative translation factor)